MFDKIVIREFVGGQDIDIGLIAETLFYYGEVKLILSPGNVVSLVKRLGIDTLIRLLSNRYVRASYFDQYFGTQTETRGGISFHRPVQFRVLDDKASIPNADEALRTQFQRNGFDASTSRQYATKIAKLLKNERLSVGGKKIEVCDMVAEDLLDAQYATTVARILVQDRLPGFQIPSEWSFNCHKAGEEFLVETNFDLRMIEERYRKRVPNDTFNAAHIQSEMVATRADLTFAAKHQCEILTTPVRSSIMQTKFSLLTVRRESAESEMELFQRVHLDGKSVRSAINAGDKTFAEFLDFLDRSQKFKHWLQGAAPDVSLLKEYQDAVTKETWLDKLPSKASRFVFMNGAAVTLDLFATGGLATTAGLALSAADSFLLDPLLKGWRPNQFVEDEFSKFLNRSVAVI